jgi:cyanosortase A-associated protein
MIPPHPRQWLLGMLSVSACLTLLQVGLRPISSDPQDRPWPLPTTLALAGWQLHDSHVLEPLPARSKYNRMVGGQRYLYQNGDRTLTVTVRDMVATEGDIGQFMADEAAQGGKSSAHSVRDRRSDNGFYRLSAESTQIHLQGCVPPQGYTIVTPTQFRQNAYLQALQPQQWVGWILGQRPLLARRCLWVQLSMPAHGNRHTADDIVLEQTWETLLPRWRSRY